MESTPQLRKLTNALPSELDKKLYLEGVVSGYLEAAIWTNEDCDGLDFTNIELSSKVKAIKDCGDFLTLIGYVTNQMEAGQMGHDFLLTRNRHGAGFWDRGLGDFGDHLTAVAQNFTSVDITLENETIYIE